MPTPIDCQAMGDDEQSVLAAPAPRYEAGSVLSGKYRLEVLLGEGGMGSVWRATNLLLDLPVAIKLIRADLDRGELRARLQFEARAAAKLGHPAIVRVYDVGESELGDPFIVMEHLRGETLGQLLSEGRMPATRAVQLLLPIMDALVVAHDRGIVHRDLKPDNLMIAREDQQICPKILDFGVAKLTDPRDCAHKLTEIGVVVGSPEYMSPEQACGRDDVDASTDIWSMCVVLYEAVTGTAPFTASNYNALLRSIVEDHPSPLSEHAAGDDELWQILERGLNKDRAQRYPKISDLAQALATWLVSHGVTEDACGSSLESKWLTRSEALSSRPNRAASSRREQAQTRPTHESIPDENTGIARPFTATIRPTAGSRTLTLGAAFAGFALLGLTLFALGHSPPSGATTVRAAAALPAVRSQAPAAANPPPPALLAPSASAPQAKIEVWPGSSAQSAAEAKPKATAPRVTKPSSGVRANPGAPSPVASAASMPPVLPKNTRPLDLMAPY
jgi:eukaryotic-like serine/threonine-protein kinase